MSEEIQGEKIGEVYETIKKAGRITLREIAASTDINYNTLRSSVIRLTKLGLVKRVERGVYEIP